MVDGSLHVAFCVNNSYAEYIKVSIKGLLENNREPISIHILSDFVSEANKADLQHLVDEYSYASLYITIVDDSVLRGLKDSWTIYTWYRVLLPDILPMDIHRVLYLDADVVVSGSIHTLFSLDMTGLAIAGTIDVQSKDLTTFQRCNYDSKKEYVCAGVLLMNLDYWRENNIAEKVVKWGRDNNETIKFPDQDAINYVCCDTKVVLPLKYDIVDAFFNDDYYFDKYGDELRDCFEHPAIIHFAGQSPWIVERANHLFQDEWMRYNEMLQCPVKQLHESKGALLLKIMIYDLIHSKKKNRKKRMDVVKNKLLGLK